MLETDSSLGVGGAVLIGPLRVWLLSLHLHLKCRVQGEWVDRGGAGPFFLCPTGARLLFANSAPFVPSPRPRAFWALSM